MEDFKVDEPMVYFQRFLTAYIQQQHPFVWVKQIITKSSQIENPNPVPVHYDLEFGILIQADQGEPKSFPLHTIEKIDWGHFDDSSKPKYINIQIKGDKVPLVLYSSSIEQMELFMDGLRLIQHQPTDTQASQNRLSDFNRACNYAKQIKKQNPKIPSPPQNIDYPKA